MRPRFALLLVVVALVLSSTSGRVQANEQPERIAAAFLLVRGRVPVLAEIQRRETSELLPFSAYLAQCRDDLQADPAAQRSVAVKAWQDAFGRTPSEDELRGTADGAGTYAERLQQHLQWLATHPAEYAEVVHRAYRFLLHRDAYDLELDYWKQQGVLPYALLVACIEDWARRNQPGLMVTTGIPTVSVISRYLAVVRLSPAVAAEVRLAAGLAPVADPALAIAAGRNVVAPGAEGISSGGGIHFVAAGAADLVPAQTR